MGRKHDSLSRESEEPAAHLAPLVACYCVRKCQHFVLIFTMVTIKWRVDFCILATIPVDISPSLSTLACCSAVRISCRVTKAAVLELVRCDWGCRQNLGCKWAWRVPSCDRSSCLFRSRSATSHFLPAGSLFISLTCCSDSRHLSIGPKSWSETFTDRWWKCSRIKNLGQTRILGRNLWNKTYFFQVTRRPG